MAAWRDGIRNRKWRHARWEARACPGNGEPGRKGIWLSPGIYTHGPLRRKDAGLGGALKAFGRACVHQKDEV